MHVDGKLNHPVTMTVNPYSEWKQVSTGLDPVKGSTNTMLLDLKIRYESQNMKSLDDVMRTLYQVYNKSKNRGFTDQEFREACELAAGCSLAEVNVKAGNTSRCTLTSLSSPRKRGLHAVR